MKWIEKLSEAWLKEPVVANSANPVLSGTEAYRAVVDAAGPYIRGMRFRALPALAMFVAGSRVPAPRAYLPTTGEADMAEYVRRLHEHGDNFSLIVTEPLFSDFALWKKVRDTLADLWSYVGFPIMPVTTELILMDGSAQCRVTPSESVWLTFVLQGTMTVTLDSGETMHLSTGEVLQLPQMSGYEVDTAAEAILLRIQVPLSATAPVADLLDMTAETLQPAGLNVPYLPIATPAVDGEITISVPDAPVQNPEIALLDLERTQCVLWAGRVSAGGLEPPPDPREPFGDDQTGTIQLTCDIYTMREPGTLRTLWAVNGHVFAVAGEVADEVLQQLRDNETRDIEELCLDEDGDDNGALPLLMRLHAVRAIELTEGDTK